MKIGDDYDDHIYHTLHTGFDPADDHDDHWDYYDHDENDYSSMIVMTTMFIIVFFLVLIQGKIMMTMIIRMTTILFILVYEPGDEYGDHDHKLS